MPAGGLAAHDDAAVAARHVGELRRLLGGGDDGLALQALARAAAEERQGDPDPGLQDVLDHIETRAAVELAKARRRTLA